MVERDAKRGKPDPNAEYREPDGKFKPGCVPGPGRPVGLPNLAAKLYRILQDDADELAPVFKKLLMDGDAAAWKMVMSRALPETHHVEHSGSIDIGPEEVDSLESRLSRLAATDAEEALH